MRGVPSDQRLTVLAANARHSDYALMWIPCEWAMTRRSFVYRVVTTAASARELNSKPWPRLRVMNAKQSFRSC